MFWETKTNISNQCAVLFTTFKIFFNESRDLSSVILLDFMIGFDNVTLFGTF